MNNKRREITFVWGCWLFGFGVPVPKLFIVCFGPLRIKLQIPYSQKQDADL